MSALEILTSGRKFLFLSGGQVPFYVQPSRRLEGDRRSAAKIPAVLLLLARLHDYHPKDTVTSPERLSQAADPHPAPGRLDAELAQPPALLQLCLAEKG